MIRSLPAIVDGPHPCLLTPLPIEVKSATLAAGTPDLAASSGSVARKNAKDSDTFVVSGPDL